MQQGLVAVDFVAQTPSLNAYVTGTLGGTFEWRPIANTNRLSAHSYGIATDIASRGAAAGTTTTRCTSNAAPSSSPAVAPPMLGQRALNVRGSLGLRTQRLVTFTPREESGLGARWL